MIPDLQSSLLCDDVRQERNGKFILIGLFDVISLPEFPAVFHRLCLINRWCCGEGEFLQHSRILKPDGNTVLVEGKPVKVNLPNDYVTATCVEFFINVKLEETGTYWVEILLENSLKLRYPVRVQKINTAKRPKGTDNAS